MGSFAAWKSESKHLRPVAQAMIPTLRQQFNARFTPEKYQTFLRRIDEACGTHVQFRLSETPCFFPETLLQRMVEAGKVLIRQLVESPDYLARSNASIPEEFRVPNEPAHPMFVQVDFGLVRDAGGELQPKLVELQAFPSLLCVSGYARAKRYRRVWTEPARLGFRVEIFLEWA